MLSLRLTAKMRKARSPPPSGGVRAAVWEVGASIRVPEFLCVSAVLETGVLSPGLFFLPQPQILLMLATCRLDSWVGLHPADLRAVLLPGKIHRSHVNVVFIRRQTDNL